ncbi:MAG TPA: enoyl-CoA hydratase/isomerase family protein [Nitriliruptorales bacterium]
MTLVEVDRRDDGIAVVTLNDPDRLNTMTVHMGEALEATFDQLATDEGLRVAVLTGAGRAFSAGGDLDMLEEYARRAREEGWSAEDAMWSFYSRFLALRRLPVPLIAAVNGHAIGAGFCVALGCDLLVLAEDARLGLNFAKLGLHPGMGGSWLLPRAAGAQRGAELLYTGRLIDGETAARYGMGLEAVPAGDVLDRALELAADIAASAPGVVRRLKASLRMSPQNTLEEQLRREAQVQAIDYTTDDVIEGLAAVRERRPPRF